MKRYVGTDFENITDSAVCIGKFDGIHLGHRLLVNETVRSPYPALMLTFRFEGQKSIYTDVEKEKTASELGIEHYVEVPATKEFFSMEPETFIKEILCKKLGAKQVVVGTDFRFGKDRTGDVKTLEKFSENYGYKLTVVDKLKSDEGEIISSTGIRKYIADGEIKKANKLLGRNYSISGTVTGGMKLGRKIEVPTANIIPQNDKLLPPFGVYAVRVIGEGENAYTGVANLGVKPTVGGDNPIGLEVNIFDFEGDIYDREIIVEFIDFIRPEKRFDDIVTLKKQIETDVKKAQKILLEQGH